MNFSLLIPNREEENIENLKILRKYKLMKQKKNQ